MTDRHTASPAPNASHAPDRETQRLGVLALFVIAAVGATLLALFAAALLGGTPLRGASSTLAEVDRLSDEGLHEEALALLRQRGLLGHPDARTRSLLLLLRTEAWHEALEMAAHGEQPSPPEQERFCEQAPEPLVAHGLDRPSAIRLHGLCGDQLEGLVAFRVRVRAGMLPADEEGAALLATGREALERGDDERVEEVQAAFVEAADATRHLQAREIHLRRAFLLRPTPALRERLMQFYAEAWQEELDRNPQQAFTWAERIGLNQVDGIDPTPEEQEAFVGRMQRAMSAVRQDTLAASYFTSRHYETDLEAGIYLPDAERFVFPPAPLDLRDAEVYAWIQSRFRWRRAPEGFNVLAHYGLCRDPEAECVLDFSAIWRIVMDMGELSRRYGDHP